MKKKTKLNIVEYLEFEKARYYGVTEEGDNQSLVERFFSEFKDRDFDDSLHTIAYYMKKLGDRGISKFQLRPEAVNKEGKYDSAIAFPVKTEFLKQEDEIPLFDTSDFEDHLALRLYGLWLSDSVLILLSGCEKTDNDPTQCSNCRPHFYLANNLSSQLERQKNNYKLTFKTIVSPKDINFEY